MEIKCEKERGIWRRQMCRESMIRKAVISDLEQIEEGYQEHFANEEKHGAYTVFRRGIYPTKKDAEEAFQTDALYVYEEKGAVLGSIIIDGEQPKEYEKINWPSKAVKEKVKVIHLLMVHPGQSGKGIGSELVKGVLKLADQEDCLAVRLDTGEQNVPAVSLYRKLGFQLAGVSAMKVGGIISHDRHLFFEKQLRNGSETIF